MILTSVAWAAVDKEGSENLEYLRGQYDAAIFATGTTVAHDLPIANRTLEGIHYATSTPSSQHQDMERFVY
ncbi:hypothetical protein OPT61_g6523 [Boeremia exigua]|uniref:Uncharacterized protein n=1 Tax=Boeremia exigua TaxID=749465 RepID=A0ACC2I6A8_9PLEO|nr:hypothetical protein OPT61_g6523 [Boeremia exigua]